MTAFRTISMRLRGYDEETEELSEDLVNIKGDIADLTKTAKNTQGVSIFEPGDPNTYKSTYQILKDISAVWRDLTDKQRAAVLEKLGGKRGGQVLSSILDPENFAMVEKALQEMENAEGSADAEMGIIVDSIDYKLNNLKETWTGTWMELLDRGDISQIIDGLTTLSNVITELVKVGGALPTLAAGLGMVLNVKTDNALFNTGWDLTKKFGKGVANGYKANVDATQIKIPEIKIEIPEKELPKLSLKEIYANNLDFDPNYEYGFDTRMNDLLGKFKSSLNPQIKGWQDDAAKYWSKLDDIQKKEAAIALQDANLTKSQILGIKNRVSAMNDLSFVQDDILDNVYKINKSDTLSEKLNLQTGNQIEEDAIHISDIMEDLEEKLTTPIETDIDFDLDINEDSIQEATNSITEIVQSATDDIDIDLGDDLFEALHARDTEMQQLNADLQEASVVEAEYSIIKSESNVVDEQGIIANQQLSSSIVGLIAANQTLNNEEKQLMMTDLQALASHKSLKNAREKGTYALYKEIAGLDELEIARKLELLEADGTISAENRIRIARIQHTSEMIKQANASKILTVATNLLKTAAMGALFAFGTWASSKAWEWLDGVINRSKKLKEAADEAAESIKNINDEFDKKKSSTNSIAKEYAELAQQVGNLGTAFQNQGSLSTEDYDKFLKDGNQLADLFPILTKGYDENGNAILDLNGNVNTITDSLDALLNKERELANNQILEKMPDIFDNYKNLINSQNDIMSDHEWKSYEQYNNDQIKKYQDLYNAIMKGSTVNYTLDHQKELDDILSHLAKNRTGSETSSWYNSIVGKNGVFNSDTYSKMGADFSFYDFSQLQLTPEDEEYLKRYVESIYATYEQDNKKIANEKKGYSNQLLEGLRAYLNTDFDYVALDDSKKKMIDEILSTMDINDFIEKNGIDSWDGLSEEINKQIISQIDKIDNEDIQNEMIKVLNGSITGDDLNSAYQQIISSLKNMFQNWMDEDGDGHELVVYWTTRYRESKNQAMSVADHILSKANYRDKNTWYDYFLSNIEELKDEEQSALQNITDEQLEALYSEYDSAEDIWTHLLELIRQTDNGIDSSTNDMVNSVTQMKAKLEPQFSAINSLYTSLFKYGEDGKSIIGINTDALDVSSLETFQKTFQDLEETLGVEFSDNEIEEFYQSIIDGIDDVEALDDAFDTLATKWYYSTDILDSVTSKNRELYEIMLKNAGVVNSTEVAAYSAAVNTMDDLSDAIDRQVQARSEYAKVISDKSATTEMIQQKHEELETANKTVNAINSEIDALINEIPVTEENAEALAMLQLKKWFLNNTTINTVGDCEQLIQLAEMAGMAADGLSDVIRLKSLMAKQEGFLADENWGAANAVSSEIEALKKSIKENVEDYKIDIDVKPVSSNGGGGGGGSSEKEKDPLDEIREKYQEQMDLLKWLRDNNFIDEKQYLDQSRLLYEQFYGNNEELAKEYYDAEKEYLDELKSQYDTILSHIISLFDKEIDKIEKEKDKRLKALEEEQKAEEKVYKDRIKAKDDEIKAEKAKLDAVNDEIDALKKANEERKRELDLQKAQYELERARNQRTKLVYNENQGYHYEADNKAIRDTQENLDDVKFEMQIAELEKVADAIQAVIDGLEDEKQALEDALSAMQEAFEKQKEQLEEYYKGLTDPLEEKKNKFEEFKDMIERAELVAKLSEFGFNVDEIMNNTDAVFETFKANYLGVINDIARNNEKMKEGFTDTFNLESLPSYLESTKGVLEQLKQIDLTNVNTAIQTSADGMIGFRDATQIALTNIQTMQQLLASFPADMITSIITLLQQLPQSSQEGIITFTVGADGEVEAICEETQETVSSTVENLLGITDEGYQSIIGQTSDAMAQIQAMIDSLQPKEVTITLKTIHVEEHRRVDVAPDGTTAISTAYTPNFDGTAHFGNAYANGKDITNGRNEKALVGELGAEIRVRDGKFDIIGRNGAELTDVRKNDIIFNHKQSEQLLKYGHINSRGKAYAGGKDNYSLLSASDPEKYKLLTSFTNFADMVQQPIIDMSKTIVSKQVNPAIANPVQNINLSIGDINLSGVQDVNGLSQAIVNQLPNQLLQIMNKR